MSAAAGPIENPVCTGLYCCDLLLQNNSVCNATFDSPAQLHSHIKFSTKHKKDNVFWVLWFLLISAVGAIVFLFPGIPRSGMSRTLSGMGIVLLILDLYPVRLLIPMSLV